MKEKKIILIEDMHCASCALTIEKALKKLNGVENANVNYASGKALIEFDSGKTDEKKIEETINKAGYHVMKEKTEMHSMHHSMDGIHDEMDMM